MVSQGFYYLSVCRSFVTLIFLMLIIEGINASAYIIKIIITAGITSFNVNLKI